MLTLLPGGALDSDTVAQSFAFDADEVHALKQAWLDLVELAMWGELKSAKLGALTRLRKRLTELGEGMRSLFHDRAWIPNARERVKGAMAASLNLRDALLNLERAAKLVEPVPEAPEDFERFEAALLSFRRRLLLTMEQHEQLWAQLLESLYEHGDDEPDEPSGAGSEGAPER